MTKPRVKDLRPEPYEVVETTRGPLAVHGVPVSKIDDLLDQNPDLAADIDASITGGKKISVMSQIQRFPRAAVDIVHMAIRPEDDEEKEILDSLLPDDVADIVLTAFNLTLPGGVVGFLSRRMVLVSAMLPAAPDPDTADMDPSLAAISGSPSSSPKSSSKPRARESRSKR